MRNEIGLRRANRRTFLQASALAAGALTAIERPLAAGAVSTAAESVAIVRRGAPVATVVHEDDADAQTRAAIDTLVHYVEAATGATLTTATVSEAPSAGTRLYVGVAGPASVLAPQLAEVGDQGYVISAAGAEASVLGNTPRGAQYGVYEILESLLGVRWLQAGDAGEDVPKTADFSIPWGVTADAPVFLTRNVSPTEDLYQREWLSTVPAQVWGGRNRIHESVRNVESLGYFFDPAIYAKTRPDFYPIIDGQRYIPPAVSAVGWQPRLSADGTVDVAVEFWVNYWKNRPYYQSYSLSINDGGLWSEDEVDASKRNSLGTIDASEFYYSWVNEVATEMAKSFPDQLCGVNAYLSVSDPPPFRLHPNVVVFLTRDRFGWLDRRSEDQDQRWLEKWKAVASKISWYDYCYGSSYCVPRVYTQLQARQWRYAAEHGVRYAKAELYPGWGEGPKHWMLAKLLWNPDRDESALMQEWCERAVGRSAADSLVRYYRSWERLWTTKVPETAWFANAPRPDFYSPFFQYSDAAYLEAFDPGDMVLLRRLMDDVAGQAETPQQQVRAASLKLAFDTYDAAVQSYQRAVTTPKNTNQALTLLNDTADEIDNSVEQGTRRASLLSRSRSDPILRYDRANTTSITGWRHESVYQLGNFVRVNPRSSATVRRRLESLAESDMSARVRRFAALTLTVADGREAALGSNMSFDDGLTVWKLVEKTEAIREPLAAVSSPVHTPGQSLLVAGGARAVRIAQDIGPVTPGYARFSLWFHTVAPEPLPVGFIVLELIARNASGSTLVSFRSAQQLLDRSTPRWQEIAVAEELPTGTASAQCKIHVQGVPWDATVYLDDAALIQLPE